MSNKLFQLSMLTGHSLVIGFCLIVLQSIWITQNHAVNINSNSKSGSIVLRVAPYPIIPDVANDQFESLLHFIKVQFETTFPNIRLVLRSMNDSNGFYDINTLTEWLASDGSQYDVVEVDTIIFGDLVNGGIIAPQIIPDEQMADWHPAAAKVVQMNNAIYGYPHLLCTSVLFTRDNRIAQARTVDDLATALGKIPTNSYRLVGNFDSSWDLPALWVQSYQSSSDDCTDMTAHAVHAYENLSFEPFKKFVQLCDRIPTENHCLDGTYRRNSNLPALLFAQKQAKAFFAYTERLSFILNNATTEDYNNIKMIPIPIGTRNNQPIFTTDAYVFRRNMSNEIRAAARTFVEFMGTPRMQAAIVGSLDSPYPHTVPRYLIPVSQKAYDEPVLANNRFYQEYFRKLTGFSNVPVGFSNTRKTLQAALLKTLKT